MNVCNEPIAADAENEFREFYSTKSRYSREIRVGTIPNIEI